MATMRERITLIGHTDLPYWNPAPADVAIEWTLPLLGPGSVVLDVGCGRGALLLEIATRTGCRGLGIDTSAAAVAIARSDERHDPARVRFVHGAFERGLIDGAYDLLVCLGSTHAFGGLSAACEAAAAIVRPGGHILVGEGFWSQDPEPAYLEAIGGTASDLSTDDGTAAVLEAAGFEVVRRRPTSSTEWAAYEDTYAANVRRFVEANPNDPDAPAMSARIESWRAAYERWGRCTLGFGLYLGRRHP